MIDGDLDIGGRGLSPNRRLSREADVAQLVAGHARLRQLCDALEGCADRLPDRDAIVDAARITAALAAEMSAHAPMAASVLRSLPSGDPSEAVEMLFARGDAMDHLHAEDLSETLATVLATPGPCRADMLGYMMRGLFDGCRRVVEFEAMLLIVRDPSRNHPV